MKTGAEGRDEPEYELLDSGVFDDKRYFDVLVEYGKEGEDNILIQYHGHQPGAGACGYLPVTHPVVPQHLELGLSSQADG
ncbi:MAG: hypothetical protein MZV64_01810 [Ignavibacteriales bacterium]|nr:hypothetical protein [Ignavibacteriales bacterium]